MKNVYLWRWSIERGLASVQAMSRPNGPSLIDKLSTIHGLPLRATETKLTEYALEKKSINQIDNGIVSAAAASHLSLHHYISSMRSGDTGNKRG